jgi:hypothetical protein
LTEYSDLSEVEMEETETAAVVMIETAVAVTVKMAAAVMVKMAAMAKMAKMAEVTETAVSVMTTAEKVVADVTDGTGRDRQHIGGNAGS